MTDKSLIPGPVPGDTYMENGRLYHEYRKGIYLYPCDEAEKDRLDMFHQMFLVARRKALHYATLDPTSDDLRILDLGTGTGIWAIDMADQYPTAEVVGLDIVNIQPSSIPRNLRFRVPRDYESPSWTALGEDSWDLIHIRKGCGSVSSWPELYQKIFRHLRPGTGYIEHVEVDFQPRCDDQTMSYNPICQWYEYIKDATQRAAKPLAYEHNTRQLLEAQGFTDIQEQVVRAPFNSWPQDPLQKEIGRWYCVTFAEGLEALSLAALTRIYKWSAEDVRRITDDVRVQVMSKRVHGYNNIHIWTARRPA